MNILFSTVQHTHSVLGDALTGRALPPAADAPGALPWPAGALGPQLLQGSAAKLSHLSLLQRTVLSWQKPPPGEPPLEVKKRYPSPAIHCGPWPTTGEGRYKSLSSTRSLTLYGIIHALQRPIGSYTCSEFRSLPGFFPSSTLIPSVPRSFLLRAHLRLITRSLVSGFASRESDLRPRL